MTTISGTQGYQSYGAQRPPTSGKERLTAAIGIEVSTGALGQTDATALTSALDAIDRSLSADRTSATESRAARLDPTQMQDRIDDLIADQVSSGALTGDQADLLVELFARQGGQGGQDGPEGSGRNMGGPGGAGGPPPGPPPGDLRGGTDATREATSGSSASDLLASFIEQLKAAQTSGAGCAASGQSGSAQASALLFDFRT